MSLPNATTPPPLELVTLPTHVASHRLENRSDMVAGVGKAKKNAFIAFLRSSVVDDADFATRLAKVSKDYQSWARVFRERGRSDAAHADALRLLDSKGHLLNIIDRICEDDGGKKTPKNLAEVRSAWDAVKKVQRAKFEKSGGAEGIAEARLRAREAKERIKQSRKERETREGKDKEMKQARGEYNAAVHEARNAGACLDWLNMGTCRFGSECQYAESHDPLSRGKLKDLAQKVGAETGDVKRERNREEKAERKARAKALRDANCVGEDEADALDFSSSDDDSDSEADVPGFLKVERAKRAAQALLSTNKGKVDKKETPAKKTKNKHFNEKQQERKARFLKDKKNQPYNQKRKTSAPRSEEKPKKKKKKPRHADSERKQKRKGIARTFFGGDD